MNIDRSEHDHQVAIMRWASIMQRQLPGLELLHAIPNGGHRHKAVAGKLKAEGVKSGVPDLCLPIAKRGYNALYIELKRKTCGNRASKVVAQRIRARREQGYRLPWG